MDRWIRDGIVAPELVPIIEARADQAEQIVEDLGGPDEVTAMQRGIIDGYTKAMVAADVEWLSLVTRAVVQELALLKQVVADVWVANSRRRRRSSS